MVIDFDQEQAWKKHVLSVYPNEAVGVLINGKFHPCVNTSPIPGQTFRVAAEELGALEVWHGPLQAMLHSHPVISSSPPKWDPRWPSTRDMDDWLKGSIPWGIVSTEGENVSDPVWLDEANPEPLLGREFIHGINDCYSIIRDWFKEQGVLLPNYARGMEWWNRGLDLYWQNFKDAGFSVIKREEVQVGDVALMQVRSPVVNHAAIVTGNNEILHHLFHRLSCNDRLDTWERVITAYVRYDKA
jgi:proteasome lid subunit RPN8/RPN11